MRHALILALLATGSARAAEHLDAAQVRAVAAASPGHAALAGADLRGDDLSGLDLTGADLHGADLTGGVLRGVKLVDANLTGAKLVRADLTFAWFLRANFDGADLRDATLQTVVTSTAMQNTPAEAARFVGADLSGSHTTVHFSLYDMQGAKFAHSDMTVVIANQSMGLLRSEFDGTNLDGADFSGAGLGHVSFRFAKLRGAHFNGADLRDADLGGAYLDGADFTGAQTDRAEFGGASLTGVVGLAR